MTVGLEGVCVKLNSTFKPFLSNTVMLGIAVCVCVGGGGGGGGGGGVGVSKGEYTHSSMHAWGMGWLL